MRLAFVAIGLASFVVVAAQAEAGLEWSASNPEAERVAAPVIGWNDWSVTFRAEPTASAPPAVADQPAVQDSDVDVVDAHWMALTMWGEARGSGEEAMRAVGHVIDNRRNAGRGGFVTETVSEAYQFSCWNPGDPNLRAIHNVDALPRDSAEYRAWQAARRIAEEILSRRSADPTDGALFYHAASVAPRWSRGVPPVRRIGGHLFFLTAR